MERHKLYEEQKKGTATVVVVTFIVLSALVIALTHFVFNPFASSTPTMPSPNNTNPKEVNLVTMEMDFATIYEALASDRCSWADVNRPKGIFYHPIHIKPKESDANAFERVIPERLAAKTAERYPQLFKYDNEKKEFTLIVTDPKKQFVVMPAWLVANMIESGTLVLP